jgi:hypothetical protein
MKPISVDGFLWLSCCLTVTFYLNKAISKISFIFLLLKLNWHRLREFEN